MSFDLGIWHSEVALSEEEAGDVYARLCDGTWAPDGEHESLHAFYAALCATYPEIDALPDDEAAHSPWSCEHSRSGMHVIVSISGSAPANVAEFVVALAETHGLVCYDPQGPDLYLPPGLRSAGRFRLEPIAMTFAEAEAAFREFAMKQGYPGEVLWTTGDELTVFWKRFVVLNGDASARRNRARSQYEQAAWRGFGVGMEAICMAGGKTICHVMVPVDELDAQYRMMPRDAVKFFLATRKSGGFLIGSRRVFRVLQSWQRRRGLTLPWE